MKKRAGYKILIVDDNQPARQLIKMTLSRIGFTDFTEVVNGEMALERLRRQSFDIVICDWDMPKMNGLECVRRVREDESLRHLKIMMLTAVAQEHSVKEIIELGISDYLIKPYRLNALQDKVLRILNNPQDDA